jgi:hypothetical protein
LVISDRYQRKNVNDTADKLFAGVNDTADKLFAGVNDTADKFSPKYTVLPTAFCDISGRRSRTRSPMVSLD